MGQNLGPLNIKDTYQDLVQVSGSLLTDGEGTVITSVDVTASYATNAGTASTAGNAGTAATATSASHALVADSATSATTATSASHAENADTAISATSATTATTASYVLGSNVDGDVASATSASYALTASYAENAIFETGSLMTTGSASGNVLTFTKGDGTTFDLTVSATGSSADSVVTASISDATITFEKGDASTFDLTVNNVVTANTASYVAAANVDGTVASATSASHAVQADSATTATTATTATSATTADEVNVASDSSNATRYVSFTDTTSGTDYQRVDAGLTYNPFTNTLTATTFNGNATSADTATSADSATSASHAENADDATTAGEVNVATDSTNATRYVSFTDTTSGTDYQRVDAGLTYNPFTNKLTVGGDLAIDGVSDVSASIAAAAESGGGATVDTGSLLVTASIADAQITFTKGDASTFNITVDNVANADSATSASYVLGSNVDGAVANATSASHAVQADSATSADSATTATTASYILGSNVDGAVANATNATDATNADNIAITSDATDTDRFVTFVAAQTGDEAVLTDAGIKYNPSTNKLTTTGDLAIDGITDVSASIALAAESGGDPIDTGSFVKNDTDTYTSTPKVTDVVTLTQAEYDALGTPDTNTMYVVPGGGGTFVSASHAAVADTVLSVFPYTGSVDIKPSDTNFSGTPGEKTAIFNIDAESGNASANSNIGTLATALFSEYSGSSSEDIEIDNNHFSVAMGGMRSQYSSFTMNGMSGSAVIACASPGNSIYAGTDGSYTSSPIGSAMIAASGQFRGGMVNSVAIGTHNVNMNGAGNYGYGMAVLGGQNARLNRNFRSVIIGGNNNQFPNSFQDGLGIFAGNSATVYGNNNTAVGCQTVTISGGSNNYAAGGRSATVGSGADTCMLLGGWDNNLASGHTDSIVGGRANTITDRNTNAEAGNGILFGRRNTLKSNNMDQNFIVAGAYNEVSGSIQGGGIIGGSGSLAFHDRSVIIGGRDMETAHTDTVYVPNFVASGSVRGEVNALSITSNTASMDCSLGNFFTLSMPAGGDVHLDPTNIRVGQTINVKTTQNATAATISFPSSVEFEGGTAFEVSTGSGEKDVMTFISFDGTSLQATGLKNFS